MKGGSSVIFEEAATLVVMVWRPSGRYARHTITTSVAVPSKITFHPLDSMKRKKKKKKRKEKWVESAPGI